MSGGFTGMALACVSQLLPTISHGWRQHLPGPGKKTMPRPLPAQGTVTMERQQQASPVVFGQRQLKGPLLVLFPEPKPRHVRVWAGGGAGGILGLSLTTSGENRAESQLRQGPQAPWAQHLHPRVATGPDSQWGN